MDRTIEHTEINGTKFALIPIIPFEHWINERYSNFEKFNSLSKKDKEKIFLRWKWGLSDDRINEELDFNEQHALYLLKDNDLSTMKEEVKFHIQQKRIFDRICYETKKRIGIIFTHNPLIDKIIDTFDAKED